MSCTMARSVPLALPAMIVTTFSLMRARKLSRVLSGDGVVRLGGVLGARRRDGGAGDQAKSHSEGNTHDQFPHFERATLVNASAPR